MAIENDNDVESVVRVFRGEDEFTASKIFSIQIPSDYDHITQLKRFKEYFENNNHRSYDYFNDNVTDEHYSKASIKLTPNKTYQVIILPVPHDRFTLTESLELLKRNSAVPVGAQGLSIVCQLAEGELPAGMFVWSIDEEEKLWKGGIGNSYKIPSAKRFPRPMGGGLSFDAVSYTTGLDKDIECLLGFIN